MRVEQLIKFLSVAEKLKCNTRHSKTSSGRPESVAEHSWRLSLFAMLCADEYPDLDMNKVVRMCIIHDLGEAITGDVPSFEKTETNEMTEKEAWDALLAMLPDPYASEFAALCAEMEAKQTPEAKLYKALDNMEAVLSHNEASLDSWIPLEYELNLTYGEENAAWSPYTQALRAHLAAQTKQKIQTSEVEHATQNG
ncbi:MAG: HD domain-containing protein [Clostridia bacterium]|nr:HD domain-containing protein [Clostridia bacterium]